MPLWAYVGMFGTILGAGIFIFFRIKRLGKIESERDQLKNENKGLKDDKDLAEKQRDIANQPDGDVDDTADWLSGND